MSPTVTTQNSKQKEVMWQQYRLCLGVAENQILGGQHLLMLGPEAGNIWWLQKVHYIQKKPLPIDSRAWQERRVDFLHTFDNLLKPLEFVPASRKHLVPTAWQVRSVLGDCVSKARMISMQAPHSIGNMRWSVTSWILQIWAYKRKQHPENGGDETSYPSPPSNCLISLMILTFPLVHKVHHLLNLRHLLDLRDHRQDGLKLLRHLVMERGREPEIHRASDCIRDLNKRNLSMFRFQWVMAMMISHHGTRNDGNGANRVSEHILTH